MNPDELFEALEVQSESPRLRWMRENRVFLHSPPSDMVGMEDDFGDPIHAFYAEPNNGKDGHDKAKIGVGATADEALGDYALKHGLKLWFEQPDSP